MGPTLPKQKGGIFKKELVTCGMKGGRASIMLQWNACALGKYRRRKMPNILAFFFATVGRQNQLKKNGGNAPNEAHSGPWPHSFTDFSAISPFIPQQRNWLGCQPSHSSGNLDRKLDTFCAATTPSTYSVLPDSVRRCHCPSVGFAPLMYL